MTESMTGKQLAGEARQAYKNGDYLSAAASFEAAAHSYSTAGDEITAAEMRNNCSVAYLMGGDAVAALAAVDGTPEVFSNNGDTRRQGLALGNLGAALDSLNRVDEAVVAYEQSADLLKQAGENDLYMKVVQSLSALQLKRGRQVEALATMQAGLADIKNPNPQQKLLKKLLQLPKKFLGR